MDEHQESEYQYAKEDFQTSAPYEELLTYKDDPFEYEIQVDRMEAYAKAIGVKNFNKMFKAYIASLKKKRNETQQKNPTDFTDQPMELEAGDWEADDSGVRRMSNFGAMEWACPHPILITERLINIDSGEEKLTLAFRKGGRWRSVVADKRTLASRNKVTELSAQGIAVTSNTAGAFVAFLYDLENLNYDRIPEHKSVMRCGYFPGEGFAPFVENIVFDGDAGYQSIFNAITSHGSREDSIMILRECRNMSITARIVIAASFASVLVAPLGALPFFVHLWGVESGTGKTVALMAAASVWGDPSIGSYIKTFNSTAVGWEKMAGFLNHLPLMLDELQLTKNPGKGQAAFDVYQLAQGTGRTRGNAAGGVDKTATWANTIITTGESPIVGSSAGAGAVNRVIEVECGADSAVIRDGHQVSNALKEHFGFLGREFVEQLYSEDQDNVRLAQELYRIHFEDLSKGDTTEKQAMAAAIIVVADTLISAWIFGDKEALSVDQIGEFLATKASVSRGARAYEYMCDWVAQNANKLTGTSEDQEVLGAIDGSIAYILANVFRKILEDAGFDSNAVLSYLKTNNLILVTSKGTTKNKRINGISRGCVWLRLPTDNDTPPPLTDADDPLA